MRWQGIRVKLPPIQKTFEVPFSSFRWSTKPVGPVILNPIVDRDHFTSIDAIADRNPARILRPFGRKRTRARIERVLHFFKRTDLLSGLRVHQVKMEIIIAILALAVSRDRIFAIRGFPIRDDHVFMQTPKKGMPG